MKRFKLAGFGVILLAVWFLLSSFFVDAVLAYNFPASLSVQIVASGVIYFLILQGFLFIGEKFNSKLLYLSSIASFLLLFVNGIVVRILDNSIAPSLTSLKILSILLVLPLVFFGVAMFNLPESVKLRRTNGVLSIIFGVGTSLVFFLPSQLIWDAGPIFLGLMSGLAGMVMVFTMAIMFFSLSKRFESGNGAQRVNGKNVRKLKTNKK